MVSTLFALLALLAVVLIWLDGARARELAVAIADELCKRRGYQLLDDTVALSRFRLSQSSQGIRIRRMFRFDYSAEGVGRRGGVVIMRGTAVERVDLGDEPEPPQAPTEDAPAKPDAAADNVVPFRRRH